MRHMVPSKQLQIMIEVLEVLLLFCKTLWWKLSCCVWTRPLRYVMEVIQRGRSAVRPPMFPPLSVVPAVSDSELSEPEYVHPFLLQLAVHVCFFSFCCLFNGSLMRTDGGDLQKVATQKPFKLLHTCSHSVS